MTNLQHHETPVQLQELLGERRNPVHSAVNGTESESQIPERLNVTIDSLNSGAQQTCQVLNCLVSVKCQVIEKREQPLKFTVVHNIVLIRLCKQSNPRGPVSWYRTSIR